MSDSETERPERGYDKRLIRVLRSTFASRKAVKEVRRVIKTYLFINEQQAWAICQEMLVSNLSEIHQLESLQTLTILSVKHPDLLSEHVCLKYLPLR